jgi:cell division transport system permease protein
MASVLDLDLPLAETPASRLLGWIAGVLVFLAVLALAVAVASNGTARRLGLEPRFVTIVLPATLGQGPSDAEVARVAAALAVVEGVAYARPVAVEEFRQLVGSWPGGETGTAALLLPRLVDVAFNPGREPELERLATDVAALSPGATVDDARPRQTESIRFARMLRTLALGAGLLLVLALVAVIVIVTRTSLELHRDTIDLLRLMGAPDAYIGRQFEHHALGGVLRGGLSGFAVGVMVVLGFLLAGTSLPGGLPQVELRPAEWLLLGCVPVTAALLTALAARLTARSGLARLR